MDWLGPVIFLAVLVLVGLYGVVIYNNLVSLKHGVSKAWANIDVLLKQRHDELPKLVETVKRYMSHERETLREVIAARNEVEQAREHEDVKQVGRAEGHMRESLMNLFAVAEDYPELKADQSFQQLQQRISGLENSIADRREYYNESVNLNNVRIEQFPDVMVARMFNFGPFDLLEFAEAEKRDVDMGNLFGS